MFKISLKITLKSKVIIIYIIIIIAFIVAIYQLSMIQIFNNKFWKKEAYNQYYQNGTPIGHRGKIETLNGEEIAYDIPMYQIILDPTQIENGKEEKASAILSENLKLDKKQILRTILDKKSKKSKYYKVGKSISVETESKIKKLFIKNKINGFFVGEDTKRIYPNFYIFNSITGFVGGDKKGKYGIEKMFDKRLKGAKGFSRVSKFKEKYSLSFGGKEEFISPKDGQTIVLTIDYTMQHILYEEMYKMFEETKSNWAAGVIVEANTGKILAMVSLPATDNKVYIKNNVIYNTYEPGSVFKPLIMGAALDEGIVKPDDIFYCPGKIKVYDRTIKDHDNSTIGYLTLKKIISKSSNVGMVQIGERFSKTSFNNWLHRYGFGAPTGIKLFKESSLKIGNPKKWSGVKIPTMSFGQGIAVTPIQLAMALTSVVNGGILYKPRIVERIEDGDIIFDNNKPEIRNRTISKETSELIKTYLRDVVENGTGKNAKIEGYDIGGKTGTSQKAENGKYGKGKYTASFVGVLPLKKPKYVALVVYDEPKGKKIYGGQIAAPVIKNVFERIAKYKDILPNNLETKTVILNGETAIENSEIKADNSNIKNYMPNLIGKTKREALGEISNITQNVEIEGEGKITFQSPKPGTPKNKIDKVYLKFQEK
ncbi:penicillin-binding protein [Haliovirga abyssi]|uniref:penicillin-binding protein n=1 Tax=Haliovirga abyssi TaxID=2996794 RepID=UPI0027DAF305|nr:penicillin-binding transpeptidase domain-containing protein [Haliovirga abyssi]